MMAQIDHVNEVIVLRFPSLPIHLGDMVLINAFGTVPTSGWSDIKLSPRFYITPPSDGILDLDFTGDRPTGMALEVVLPVAASTVIGAPDWLKGVRVHGNPSIEQKTIQSANLKKGNAPKFIADKTKSIYRRELASYDDSINTIGFCSGFGHLKMKKLRHELTLVVEGPDDNKVQSCVNEAAGVGLIAAIIAVYATGGGGLSAAVSAFLAHIEACLGNQFSVKIEDSSHWIEWCT